MGMLRYASRIDRTCTRGICPINNICNEKRIWSESQCCEMKRAVAECGPLRRIGELAGAPDRVAFLICSIRATTSRLR